METLLTGANILLVLLGFGLLILVHEAGHFIAAKWAGIRTDAFAIGFGPVLCSWRKGVGFRMGSSVTEVEHRTGRPPRALTDEQLARYGIGETEYSLRILPLGGFVRMLGQDDLDPGAVSGDPRAYNRASIGKRMIVVSAGVFMNIVLAAGLFVIAFTMGVRFDAPVVGDVRPGSGAALAVVADGDAQPGLRSGDHIKAINGRSTPTFADIRVAAAMAVPGEPMVIEVDRGGTQLQFTADIEIDPVTNLPELGVYPAASTTLLDDPALAAVAARLLPQVPADARPSSGWTLTGLGPQGHVEQVEVWSSLQDAAARTAGQPFDWWWETPRGEPRSSQVSAAPQWQHLQYVDATAKTPVAWEEGILGLVPLVEIRSVIDGGANEGVLQAGDVVLAFDGVSAPRMREFREIVARQESAGQIPMTVLRDGVETQLQANIAIEGFVGGTPKLQVYPAYAWHTPRIAQPMRRVALAGGPGTPAAIATPLADLPINPGDQFIVPDDDGLSPWRALWVHVHQAIERGDDSFLLTTDDGGSPVEHTIELDDRWKEMVAALAWRSPLPQQLFKPLQVTRSSGGNPLQAVSMGLHETWNFVVLTYVTIDRLFRGTVGVEQLHGPVGIVHLGTRIADRGLAYMLFFLALISVNLAVLNFLPLPIVDGGLMLYLIYEKFKGRPPSVEFQNGAALLGLLLIGTLFIVTFYNDLLRLVG
ncbi:MAG: site-2 protease family protein [Phycisphaerales bacterium]|nr:site-2 protease family protein [Phycisphaerales bacterium]